VQTKLDDYEDSIEAAVIGGPVETAIKDAKRIALAAVVRPLSGYVTTICDNDLAKLLSSGLPVSNTARTPIGPLTTPATPRLSTTTVTGELNAVTAPINGAATYNWRVALASAPTVFVQTAQTVGGRITFEGLTPGLIYNVQVNAIGAAGTTNWSDDATMMVI
jgi:hypothetical protein